MPKLVKNTAASLVVITELELVAVETATLQLQYLRKKVRQAEASLEQQETSVISKLKAGAAIQGSRTATVQTELGQCRPKWQELHLKHLAEEHGIAEAQAVEDARKLYPPKSVEVLVIGQKPPTT